MNHTAVAVTYGVTGAVTEVIVDALSMAHVHAPSGFVPAVVVLLAAAVHFGVAYFPKAVKAVEPPKAA